MSLCIILLMACADNSCFWKAIRSLYAHNTGHYFAVDASPLLTWVAKHPLEWTEKDTETMVHCLGQFRKLLDEACPGFVSLVMPPAMQQLTTETPAMLFAEKNMWSELTRVAERITVNSHLGPQVPRFYPNLTPAALLPYEREFHARHLSWDNIKSIECGRLLLAYRAGFLVLVDGSIYSVKVRSVEHLVYVGHSTFKANHNNHTNFVFKMMDDGICDFVDEEKSHLRVIQKGNIHYKPWNVLPTLLEASLRTICKYWTSLPTSTHDAFNGLLQSWSTSEPRTKRARHDA